MAKFGFDGFGVNDYEAEYKPRVATLTEHGHAIGAGPLLAAAPDLLEALEVAAGIVLWALDNGANKPAVKAAHKMIEAAIAKAQGGQ